MRDKATIEIDINMNQVSVHEHSPIDTSKQKSESKSLLIAQLILFRLTAIYRKILATY